MYTLVPDQLRRDMERMAEAGTTAVAIAVLEQDLEAASNNIEHIGAAAAQVEIELWAVPSRWGGLVAGAPKVPSLWASTRPDTWALDADGRPNQTHGPSASVHHPLTQPYFEGLLRRLFSVHDFAGLVWDEPKRLTQPDFSSAACEAALADGARLDDERWYRRQMLGFFDGLNALAKSLRPGATTTMFLHGHAAWQPALLDIAAACTHLDTFGLDGRPWGLAASAALDGREEDAKSIIDHGPAFLEAARRHGKAGFALIENHNLSAAAEPLMEQGLPDVFALGFDWLAYYYFPRAVERPDAAMAILFEGLRTPAAPRRQPA